MLEAQWLETTSNRLTLTWNRRPPTRMLEFLGKNVSLRKARLYGCSACRLIWPLLTDESSRAAVASAEEYADGLITNPELTAAHEHAAEAEQAFSRHCVYERNGLRLAATAAAAAARPTDHLGQLLDAVTTASGRAFSAGTLGMPRGTFGGTSENDLVREIFGNPFRHIVFSPSWRTSTAVALAGQMYEAREFSAMPILADALQDAGCDSADVLDHCRGPGPHVRGCWVVDLVLGKERAGNSSGTP